MLFIVGDLLDAAVQLNRYNTIYQTTAMGVLALSCEKMTPAAYQSDRAMEGFDSDPSLGATSLGVSSLSMTPVHCRSCACPHK